MNAKPQEFTASTADGTLHVRQCTCTYTWGLDTLGHVTEARIPGLQCPTHPDRRTVMTAIPGRLAVDTATGHATGPVGEGFQAP